MISKEKKKEVIEQYKKSPKDTASASVQIAVLTERINQLSEHFKTHVKDHGSKRGFMKLIGRRKRFMNYLRKENRAEYNELVKKLGL